MSFAEFGSSSNSNKKRQQQRTSHTQSNSSQLSSVDSTTLGLNSISEALLQYQRNVDILAKIVRSITSSHVLNPNMTEYCTQYEAQVDVLGLLEQKVQKHIQQQLQQSTVGPGTNPQIATVITKLSRDFERVQSQSKSLQESVISKIKTVRTSNTSNNNTANYGLASGYDASNGSQQQVAEANYAEQQRLMQIQMQEDRLAEEIMREREEEIRNINRGMHQVNEIYKDLAHLVGEQQEQIDTIETQMDDARANAEAGLKQVEKANEKYGSNQCVVM